MGLYSLETHIPSRAFYSSGIK